MQITLVSFKQIKDNEDFVVNHMCLPSIATDSNFGDSHG